MLSVCKDFAASCRSIHWMTTGLEHDMSLLCYKEPLAVFMIVSLHDCIHRTDSHRRPPAVDQGPRLSAHWKSCPLQAFMCRINLSWYITSPLYSSFAACAK